MLLLIHVVDIVLLTILQEILKVLRRPDLDNNPDFVVEQIPVTVETFGVRIVGDRMVLVAEVGY